MRFQLLGNSQNILSSYSKGFILFYLPEPEHGTVRNDIGPYTTFKDYIVQHPFQGELNSNQLATLEEYAKTLVIDAKGLVWRIVANTVSEAIPYFSNKRMHEGQSNQKWGSQTSTKTTDAFNYNSDDFPGSLKSLKDRGLM